MAGSYDLFARRTARDVGARRRFHSINFVDLPRRLHPQRPGLVQREAQRAQRRGEPRRRQRQPQLELRLRGVFVDPLYDDPPLTEEKAEIEALRRQQIKNFLTILFLSQGTPMLLYGDEMRRTAEGDNNTVFQDNSLNWINWENLKPERHGDILPLHQADHRLPQAAPTRSSAAGGT